MKIYKKGSDKELQTHEDPAFGPCYRIIENYSYIIETEGDELIHPAATRIKDGVYELLFNNFVGWSRLNGELMKVVTPKLRASDFDAMLHQITEVYTSLPFAFNTPSFLPFERIAPGGEDILYHAFMYLRYIALNAEANLESIVNRIIANPHRVLLQEQERQPIHRAKRFRPASLNRLVSCTCDLLCTENAPHLAQYEVAKRLRGASGDQYFPTHIECTKKTVSLDTPENRFVKHFVSYCLYLAEVFHRRFIRMAAKGRLIDYGLVDDTHRMIKTLESLLARAFFDELGEMQHLPYNSQVLQKAAGYRELFMYFNRMNLGSTYPMGCADLMKIIQNKDIALLYEYWTFFACLDGLRDILGEPNNLALPDSDVLQSELPWNLCADFGEGISLFYNKTYRGHGKESYSLSYRPDISLETGDSIYIFDAKFKKENVIDSQFESEETAESEEEEFSQGFKYGDINKMHCYRDAINGVKAAFILYPGTRFRFFHRTEGKAFSIDDFSSFDGVGAIPLRPSGKSGEKVRGAVLLSEVLCKVLQSELYGKPVA